MFIQALCDNKKILLNTNWILYVERVPNNDKDAPHTVFVTFQCDNTTKQAIVKKNDLRCSVDTPFSNEEAINWLSDPF